MKNLKIYTVCAALLFVALIILSCDSRTSPNLQNVPTAPSNLSGAPGSPYQIFLIWRDNSDNEDGFDVYRRLSSFPVWAKLIRLPANTVTFADSGLVDSTAYYYYVSAYNAAGNSPASIAITVTTPAVGVAPEAPHDPNPMIGSDSISINPVLNWQCSDPDGDTLTYDIYLGLTNPPYMADTNHVTNSYYAHDLRPDTLYYWRVIARDPHKHRTPNVVDWWFRTLAP